MSELEDTITRIRTQKSVQSYFIVKSDGEVERSSYSNEKKEEAQMVGYAIHQLAMKARSTVRDVDPTVSFE